MRHPAQFQRVLFFLLCVFVGSPVVLAQSSPSPDSNCGDIVTCDKLKELSGKKVYPKIIIDDVSFDGPVSLPHAALEEIIESLTTHAIDADPKWLEVLEEVPIRGAWQDHGYFKAEASAKAIPHGGDATYQHYSVIFHVNEGSLYWLGDITFRSADPDERLVFSTDELRKLLSIHTGDLFIADKIRKSLDALKALYRSKGFIDFSPVPLTEVDDKRHLVSLDFVLDQRAQYRIGKITICGSNLEFEAEVNSRFASGEVFNSEPFEAFFQSHQAALGPHFFPENIEIHRDIKAGTLAIKISLKNCRQSPN